VLQQVVAQPSNTIIAITGTVVVVGATGVVAAVLTVMTNVMTNALTTVMTNVMTIVLPEVLLLCAPLRAHVLQHPDSAIVRAKTPLSKSECLIVFATK
jgi:hypothetical protein